MIVGQTRLWVHVHNFKNKIKTCIRKKSIIKIVIRYQTRDPQEKSTQNINTNKKLLKD